MKFIAIIPARYASTRFPGKPLADMGGKPMIQRVYEQVKKAVKEVWVATDDSRIFDAVENFGGKAVMTSTEHRSGTDRIQEAYTKIAQPFDVIINVQGDEPFIQPEQIEALKNCFDSST
ncbi:NTP transferase domain-containing protein, partial [Dysgonomonas sp. OttesenSCG-928-D17]|nr:NTP transferase domain-containing protein [Dysgonomonas sp. OttesenSCG-928-D17]